MKMAAGFVSWIFTFVAVISLVWSAPIPFREDLAPFSVVSDLNSRLASRTSRRQVQDPRLPVIPTAQDLEAIKKVAQILVMLGEQVIPGIIGEPHTERNVPPATTVVDDHNNVANDNPI